MSAWTPDQVLLRADPQRRGTITALGVNFLRVAFPRPPHLQKLHGTTDPEPRILTRDDVIFHPDAAL